MKKYRRKSENFQASTAPYRTLLDLEKNMRKSSKKSPMPDSYVKKSNDVPEIGTDGEATSSDGMIVDAESCRCWVLEKQVPPLFGQKNVNLSHWMNTLKKIRREFEKIQNKNFVLSCVSIREPYRQLEKQREQNESTDHGQQETETIDYEALTAKCKNYFDIKGEVIAVQNISWSPKLYMPVISEHVSIGHGHGWKLHLTVKPGYEEEMKKVRDAMFVENSKECLLYYSDNTGLHKCIFDQYERLCQNAFDSLFPLPDEFTNMLQCDVKNFPPTECGPVSIWTFLLFNLAWKLHPYTTLRAKKSTMTSNGQFVFRDNITLTVEAVQCHNLAYQKGVKSILPWLSGPIIDHAVVSALENTFVASMDAIDLLVRRIEEQKYRLQSLRNNITITMEYQTNEQVFRDKIIEPLLRSMKYRNVRNTHGANELGKDFIVKDGDRASEYYIAFVVKAGNVSGAANSKAIREIMEQIDMAFTTPHQLPDEPTDGVYMSKVIVAISGKYQVNAITRLSEKYVQQFRAGHLQFWDKAKIETLIREHGI